MGEVVFRIKEERGENFGESGEIVGMVERKKEEGLSLT